MINIQEIITRFAHDTTDAHHERALSMQPAQLITVNAYGEMTPYTSDVDAATNHIVFIANTTMMNEDWFDLLMQCAKSGNGATVYYTSIKYTQYVSSVDDVYTMCDVLELVNNQ